MYLNMHRYVYVYVRDRKALRPAARLDRTIFMYGFCNHFNNLRFITHM